MPTPPDSPPGGWNPDDRTDRLYLSLKGAREKLCVAQTDMPHGAHRQHVEQCIRVIDRLGVFYAPQQWSKFDEPDLPGEGELDPMTAMSQAIRGQLERHGPNLKAIPTQTLADLSEIVSAYAADMQAELRRRRDDDPPLTLADHPDPGFGG
jgi:hypothetical protein